METFIAPLRDKINAQLENTSQLEQIAAYGAEKARKSARETMNQVREAIGFKTN
jgi:tryptophanyl-tRNA synthetase